MRRKTILPASLALFLMLAPLAAFADNEYRAQVVAVSDGDTLTVLHDGSTQKVRLSDIDCPEKSQDFGSAAKKETARLAFGKTVTVQAKGHDRYKRQIAQVTLSDGTNLNRELVRTGFAWCFTKYSRDAGLLALQQEAKSDRRGCGLHQIRYRHGNSASEQVSDAI